MICFKMKICESIILIYKLKNYWNYIYNLKFNLDIVEFTVYRENEVSGVIFYHDIMKY